MKKFIFGIVSIIVVGIVVVDTKGTVLSVHFVRFEKKHHSDHSAGRLPQPRRRV